VNHCETCINYLLIIAITGYAFAEPDFLHMQNQRSNNTQKTDTLSNM